MHASTAHAKPSSTLQGTANVHVWARVLSWMSFAGRVRSVAALRSTCTKGRLGFDVAVHAGWIPLAAHAADVVDDEGATCRWVGGWFPITIGAAGRLIVAAPLSAGDSVSPSAPRGPADDRADRGNETPFVVRMEHRLVAPANFRVSWAAPHVIVCETIEFGEERPATAGLRNELTTKMLSTCGAERLSFQLAPSTTEVAMTALSACRRTAVAVDTTGFAGRVCNLGRGFLSGFLKLTDINLGGLGGVDVLSDQFLANCFNLETVSTAPGLRNVCTITSNFLAGNCNLTQVDLAGLSSVTELGDFFMRGCSALEELDLSGLRNVRAIGKNLFSGCISITRFGNLDALANLASIGPEAFEKCVGLAEFDAACFRSLTSLGEGFMSHCEMLRRIDVGPILGGLDSVPPCFMMECHQLTAVHAVVPQPQATRIDDASGAETRTLGYGFLAFSKALEGFSTSTAPRLFGGVSVVEGAFFSNSAALRVVDLSGLVRVREIHDGFLSGCVSLERLSTKGMTSVTSIGDFFAANCESVQSIDLSDVADTVTQIGSGFLAGTSSVAEITGYDATRGFAMLQSVGPLALRASAMEMDTGFGDALHTGIHRRAAAAAAAAAAA
jgi:hypothetical protein